MSVPGMRYLKLIITTLLFVFIYCTDDQGIVSPSDQNSVTPLAQFQGYVVNEGDTAISAARLLKIQNPKIAILWQFLEFTRFTSDMTFSATETQLPFKFSGSLQQPPPPQVYNSNEVAIGMLILYSDVNNNGRFDREIHPKLKNVYLYLDSLSKVFDSLRNELAVISTTLPEAIDWKDTFSIGYDNSIIQYSSGRRDTIKPSIPWGNYTNRRMDILRNDRKWDDFFINRKRTPPINFSYEFLTGFYRHFEVSYKRKLFPKPGKSAEFERLLEKTATARYVLGNEADMIIITAYLNGWLSYPYDGFNEPGQDWILGRTQQHFIFYFPDQKSIQELLDAEKISSFAINHKERIKPGYNLMISNDQYRCDILPWSDSIVIQLGMDNLYGNSVSPLVNPVTETKPATLDNSHMEYAEGSYEYMPFNPLMLHTNGNTLWANIPQIGICKLDAADSIHYFSISDNVQLELVRFNGKTEKVLVYRNGERFVGTAGNPDSTFDAFKKKVASLASRKPVPINDTILNSYASQYIYGVDSIQVAATTGHLEIRFSGKTAEPFYPLNDSVFFTNSSDRLLKFKRNTTGVTYELQLIRDTICTVAPSRLYIPRSAGEISGYTPVVMNTILDSSGGSGTDLFCKLTNSCRYAPPSDARFLQEGDGALVSFVRGSHDDAITCYGPDNYMVFQLNGMDGKTVGFELYIKGQKDMKQNSPVRLYCQGGTSISGCNQKLFDDQYYSLNKDSTTLVSVNPVVVTSNPYFIKIGSISTAAPTPCFAIDSYRIGAE